MRRIVIIILMLTSMLQAQARVSTPEQIKTLFVFNFLKYIKWENNEETYKIAYIGSKDALFEEFKTMAEIKTIGGKKIKVEIIDSPSQASSYHLVYISEKKASTLKGFPQLTNTVLVTEKQGSAQNGSFINFITVDGKIRFEVNKKRFNESKVKISTQLLNLAILV